MATTTVNIVDMTAMTQGAPTNNWGNTALIFVAAQPSSDNWRIIFRGTLPAGSGVISDVKLFMYKSGTNGTNTALTLDCHVLTQTAWVENQATWNIYSTGNNWTTGGGDFSGTVVDKINHVTTNNIWRNWSLMGADADNPLTLDWEDTVEILIKMNTEGGTSNFEGFQTDDSTTPSLRPYLEITYSEGAVSNNGFLAWL